MKTNKLTPLTFSQQVEKLAQDEHLPLLTAMVSVCDEHGVDYDEVCRHEVDGARVNLITNSLKAKLYAECAMRGMLKDRINNFDVTEFIDG